MRDCGTKHVGNDVKVVTRLAVPVMALPQSFGSHAGAAACLGKHWSPAMGRHEIHDSIESK
jgi:hypothetical protein